MTAEALSTDLSAITSILASTVSRWETLADRLPADLFFRSPLPGEWSAGECLGHLIDTERHVFPARVDAFLADEAFPAFDPDTQGTPIQEADTPAYLVATFRSLRMNGLKTAAKVAVADFERQGHHPDLGAVTLGQLMYEWAAHDLSHTVQAERAVMKYFVEHCGPWEIYFDV
jgi:hypothetical protein